MANQTSKEIKNKLEQLCKRQAGALLRNPDFIKEYKKWEEVEDKFWDDSLGLTNNELSELQEKAWDIKNKICEKFNVGYLFKKEDPDFWRGMSFSAACHSPDKSYFDFIKKVESDHPGGMLKLTKQQLKELTKHRLRDNRFAKIEVDMYRDVGIIIDSVRELINGMQREMKKYGLLKRFDKSPHRNKIDRYREVYDLRNSKPPMKFEKISLSMLSNGYYKGKSKEQAINLAKKDYGVYFKEIYGISYKKYDKSKLKKSDFKGCDNCEAKKNGRCKELCPEAEYYLSLFTKKRSEALFNRGVIDIIPYEILKAKKQRKKILIHEDENELKMGWFQKGLDRRK